MAKAKAKTRKTKTTKTTSRKPAKGSAFMKPLKLSSELESIVGKGPMPRTEITKKLWAYIKRNKLQNPKNLRNIKPDDKLSRVLGSKEINMFAMTKAINKHVG